MTQAALSGKNYVVTGANSGIVFFRRGASLSWEQMSRWSAETNNAGMKRLQRLLRPREMKILVSI